MALPINNKASRFRPTSSSPNPVCSVAIRSAGVTIAWEGDGYAYARIQQTADRALYFSRVGDSKPLYTALNAGTLTAATVDELRPTVDVLRLFRQRQAGSVADERHSVLDCPVANPG